VEVSKGAAAGNRSHHQRDQKHRAAAAPGQCPPPTFWLSRLPGNIMERSPVAGSVRSTRSSSHCPGEESPEEPAEDSECPAYRSRPPASDSQYRRPAHALPAPGQDQHQRVPGQPAQQRAEGEDDQAGLEHEVAAGAQEAGHPLGPTAERVRIDGRTAGRAARGAEIVPASHQRPAWVTRQSAGRTRSSTSSTVTAPTSRPEPSVTGIATTS